MVTAGLAWFAVGDCHSSEGWNPETHKRILCLYGEIYMMNCKGNWIPAFARMTCEAFNHVEAFDHNPLIHKCGFELSYMCFQYAYPTCGGDNEFYK